GSRDRWSAPWPPYYLCQRILSTGVIGGVFLLCDGNEQGADQSAIVAGQRRIIGVVLMAEYRSHPGVRVFLDQGLIRRSGMIELGIDGRLAIFGDQRGLGPDKILAIVRENGGIDLGLCLSRGPGTAAY